MSSIFNILQLADSSFPTGGFAHSAGLEAAVQHGEVSGIAEFESFLLQSLWQVGFGSLPLLNASYANPQEILKFDEICDVFLSNHVANRASRVQGRTFLATCRRSFQDINFADIEQASANENFCSHYSVLFGAIFCALKIDLKTTQEMHLHFALRAVVSAAIRLGLIGPYEAQRIQYHFAAKLSQILNHCKAFGVSDLAQTALHLDLFQSNHDRLYSRLFQT